MAQAGAEAAGLSKPGEPQEGNMTRATPDTSPAPAHPAAGPDPVPQLRAGAAHPGPGAPQGTAALLPDVLSCSHHGMGGKKPCPAVNWDDWRVVLFFPVSLEVSVWH